MRLRLAAAAGLAVFCGGACLAAELESTRLKVVLDERFPRVLRYEYKATGTVLDGTAAGAPNALEINGAPFTELDLGQPAPMRGERKYRLAAAFTKGEARYTFRAYETYGVLMFDIVFRLDADSLVMRLERVAESGQYRLYTLYFPHHDLLAAQNGGGVFRAEFVRADDGRGLIRWRRIYNGPVSGLEPDREVQPTHWAMVTAPGAVAFLTNNIPVFPVHTFASGRGKAAQAVSLWNGPYHYRVNGEVVDPLVARIRFAADENSDGRIDWQDGAVRLRESMAAPGPEYDDAFVYKIFCARPAGADTPDRPPAVSTTFAQALDIVKAISGLTNGRPQIVYLVGWQHSGHDSRWPDMSVINPHLGGKEGLLALMKEARKYNATISFHMNIDDVYKSSPAWDERVVCRKPDGELMDWQVFNGEMAYHASHAKDAQYGGVFARIDQLLREVPLAKSVHIDAMRYSNESWDADRFIDMTAEFQGWSKIAQHFREHGISITTEGAAASPAFVGRVAGFWHLPGKLPDMPYFWFLAHRRWASGGNKSPERSVFGISRDRDITAETPLQEIVEGYYLDTLLQKHFEHLDATGFSDDGKRLAVTYGKSCTATYDRKSGMLHVESGGIPIAIGTGRFVPVDGGILAYSKPGGEQKWQLPANWRGTPVLWELTAGGRKPGPKCRLEGRAVSYLATPGRPYLITGSKERNR